MLSVIEARDRILGAVSRLGVERVDLMAARGRVLAEEIRATRQQPPWDNSAMDGYALRSADITGASPEHPVVLRVVEEIQAGALPRHTVGPGEAARIFTGAPLPPGADAVLRQEDTTAAPGQVHVLAAVEAGRDIRRAGEDQEVGDLLLSPGTWLRPAELGLAAGTRRTRLTVVRRPRVAILSTGDELCEPDEVGHDGQIVNTNATTLAAQVEEAGCLATVLPIAPDEPEALRALLVEALEADAVLSSGGVSVGDHDHVKAVLESLGVAMDFWRIRMTPGKPVAFGTFRGRPVFGLPGNPVSSMVTFEVFVRPALLKMAGRRDLFRGTRPAVAAEGMGKRALPQFLRVVLSPDEGRVCFRSTGAQGSGILRSMSLAEGLAFVDDEAKRVEAGTTHWVMGLDERMGTAETRPF